MSSFYFSFFFLILLLHLTEVYLKMKPPVSLKNINDCIVSHLFVYSCKMAILCICAYLFWFSENCVWFLFLCCFLVLWLIKYVRGQWDISRHLVLEIRGNSIIQEYGYGSVHPECLGLGVFWMWGHPISWSTVLEIFLKT